MTKKSNINLLSNEILSIQASLNGLSFCILNTTESNLVFFKEIRFKAQKNPIEVEKILFNEFESNLFLQKEFKKVNLIHHNNICTFVPVNLFNSSKSAEYLKFNNKIFESDFIANDTISNKEIISVYIPFVNLNNSFFDRFGSFEYQHSSTLFLNKILERSTNFTNTLFCNITLSSFELLYIKNGSLNLFNSFEFNTKEDFMYYLLFSIEQLGLDTNSIELKLFGDIKLEDELYNLIYTYIRNVSFGENSTTINIEDTYKKSINSHNYFSLLNSF